MFNNKKYIIDSNECNDILQIDEDFHELNEENSYFKDNSEYNKNSSNNLSNSNQFYNYLKYSNIELDMDVDPNFIDINLKKEEEKRRKKEVE